MPNTSKLKPAFGEVALEILDQRYIRKDDQGNRLEDEAGMLERCSFGRQDYYEMLANLYFLPNTPTLVNLGTGRNATYSACFKFDLPDDYSGIMDVYKKAAMVLKWGGGVGYTFSALRARGSLVAGTHRVAGGPEGFLPMFHQLARTVEQGGVRPGAQMAILHCDHPDVDWFIHAKDTDEKANALSTFNISVAATDRFMQMAKEEWELKDRHSTRPEFQHFLDMVDGAWKTGDPGCYFIDVSERTNPTPWLGKLTGTNPCGEVPLLDNEPCNLGSLNLGLFVRSDGRDMDWALLTDMARLATFYLDDVLDANMFPHPDIDRAARLTRKLGLGVMGLADALAILHIPYDSDEARALSDQIATTIKQTALKASQDMVKSKGPGPWFEQFRFGNATQAVLQYVEEGEVVPRNATRTCIAPTGTISTLAGASNGIEPYYGRETRRRMANGTEFLIRPWPVEDELVQDSWLEGQTANAVSWQGHVKMQGVWQKHVDLAVSKTVNLPNSATREDIAGAYIMAWEEGCKGITVFRDGCRSTQVLTDERAELAGQARQARQAESAPSLTVLSEDELQVIRHIPMQLAEKVTKWEEAKVREMIKVEEVSTPALRHMPTTGNSVRHKFYVGEQKCYLHVGLFEDGTPGEVFIRCNREGSTVSGMLEAWGITISKALQYGTPLPDLCRKLIGMRFEPYGLTNNSDIPVATSIIDYIARWLLFTFYNEKPKDEARVVDAGGSCPDCGASLMIQGGCETCSALCGYSRCG